MQELSAGGSGSQSRLTPLWSPVAEQTQFLAEMTERSLREKPSLPLGALRRPARSRVSGE